MRELNSICIVIPAFNEESSIERTLSAVLNQLGNLEANASVIIVNDGSVDQTLKIIKDLASKDQRINYLSFTRNFGHQTALRAGIDAANSDVVITMDADLQHPPELIPQMLKQWESGVDIVYGVRGSQEASESKKLGSKAYSWFLKSLADYPLVDRASDFRLIDRKVCKLVSSLDPEAVFLRGIIPWFGFKSAVVSYDEKQREDGTTRFSLRKMIQLAVMGMMSVSAKPLRLVFALGMGIALIAFIYGLYAIGVRLFTPYAVPGWTSILVSVLFIGGLQLAAIGILGEYLAKIFLKSLNRPTYVISEQKLDSVDLAPLSKVSHI